MRVLQTGLLGQRAGLGGKGLSSGWARPEGCRCGGGWLGWQAAEREEGQEPGRNPIFSHRFPDGNPIFPDENFRCWKFSGRKKTNTKKIRTPFGQPEAQKSWKNRTHLLMLVKTSDFDLIFQLFHGKAKTQLEKMRATLERNAFLDKKCTCYEACLKVRAPGYVIYSEL